MKLFLSPSKNGKGMLTFQHILGNKIWNYYLFHENIWKGRISLEEKIPTRLKNYFNQKNDHRKVAGLVFSLNSALPHTEKYFLNLVKSNQNPLLIPFSDWYGMIGMWWLSQINRKMGNTIRLWFDLRRFRNDISVYWENQCTNVKPRIPRNYPVFFLSNIRRRYVCHVSKAFQMHI